MRVYKIFEGMYTHLYLLNIFHLLILFSRYFFFVFEWFWFLFSIKYLIKNTRKPAYGIIFLNFTHTLDIFKFLVHFYLAFLFFVFFKSWIFSHYISIYLSIYCIFLLLLLILLHFQSTIIITIGICQFGIYCQWNCCPCKFLYLSISAGIFAFVFSNNINLSFRDQSINQIKSILFLFLFHISLHFFSFKW